MPEFKKGDVVQLKSSSPKMTIDSVEEYGSGNNSNRPVRPFLRRFRRNGAQPGVEC